MGTLRDAALRLAQSDAELRPHLVRLLASDFDPKDIQTRQLLAGAYKASDPRSMLTHSYVEKLDKVLCGKVMADHIADEYSGSRADLAKPPTCKTCLKRDPRFK
jgi:hypothetical protein